MTCSKFMSHLLAKGKSTHDIRLRDIICQTWWPLRVKFRDFCHKSQMRCANLRSLLGQTLNCSLYFLSTFKVSPLGGFKKESLGRIPLGVNLAATLMAQSKALVQPWNLWGTLLNDPESIPQAGAKLVGTVATVSTVQWAQIFGQVKLGGGDIILGLPWPKCPPTWKFI